MPGKSTSDFEVGQWVAITEARKLESKQAWRFTAVGEIFAISGGMVLLKHYWKNEDGTASGSTGGFFPYNVHTADEMEELMYHCSYCGVEGHNRRTCPKLELAEKGDMKVNYSRGIKIDFSSLKEEDLFMVKLKGDHSSGSNTHDYEDGVFKHVLHSAMSVRGTTVDNGGHANVGTFGKEWNFGTSEWDFYDVETSNTDGTVSLKTLPIWSLIEIVLPVSRLTLLYGPPGTGKTTAGNFLGEPKEVYNITLTEETPAAELRGHFVPKGNEFVWMDGPALTAFKNGSRLVLNEIDKASGDALTFCHALLDDPGIAAITLPYKDEEGGVVTVKPHPDFHVVATMNGEPEDLPEALRDRFAVRINVDKVHPNAIKSLPKDLQKIATKGVSKDGDRSVSIRGWNAFVQLRAIVGEENAARAVFGSRANTILNTIKIDGLETSRK